MCPFPDLVIPVHDVKIQNNLCSIVRCIHKKMKNVKDIKSKLQDFSTKMRTKLRPGSKCKS
jgi:hypothetical protein